jgi:hypothetical protein
MKEKNNESMNTVVETFLIEETVDLIYDNDKLDEWNNLVSDLGLEGQTKIIKKDKSPIPFMHMKTSLQNVFSELCPVTVGVDKYNITPIPLEILNLISLSKKEGYFNKIEIWYDDKDPDPVCVGVNGHWYEPTWYSDSNEDLDGKRFNTEEEAKENGANHPCFSTENKYLLGRWGDVNRPINELKDIAKERYINRKSNDLHKAIKASKRELDDLENEAFDKFN